MEWKRRRAKIAEHEAREHEHLRQEHDRLKGVLGVRQDSRGTLSADTRNESSVPVTSASRNAKTTSNVKGKMGEFKFHLYSYYTLFHQQSYVHNHNKCSQNCGEC